MTFAIVPDTVQQDVQEYLETLERISHADSVLPGGGDNGTVPPFPESQTEEEEREDDSRFSTASLIGAMHRYNRQNPRQQLDVESVIGMSTVLSRHNVKLRITTPDELIHFVGDVRRVVLSRV